MIALAIILALFASPAFCSPARPQRLDNPIYLNAIAMPAPCHVIEGDCMSACTMWLGYRWTCVRPDAELWFHAGSIPVATETMFAIVSAAREAAGMAVHAFHHLVGVLTLAVDPSWRSAVLTDGATATRNPLS